MELSDIMQWGETVQSGPYEGMYKGQRFAVKALPGVKGIMSDVNPRASNTFLKSRPLNWLFNLALIFSPFFF